MEKLHVGSIHGQETGNMEDKENPPYITVSKKKVVLAFIVLGLFFLAYVAFLIYVFCFLK